MDKHFIAVTYHLCPKNKRMMNNIKNYKYIEVNANPIVQPLTFTARLFSVIQIVGKIGVDFAF